MILGFALGELALGELPAPPPVKGVPNGWQNYDVGEAFWEGQPDSSAVIGLLTHQKFYGAGGQAPTKRWCYDHDVGEAFWIQKPQSSTLLAPLLTAAGRAKPFRWNYGIDDQPIPPLPTKERNVLLDVSKPPTKLWRYDFDIGETFWAGEPDPSAIIPLLTQQKFYGAGGQVKYSSWNYGLDDSLAFLPSIERPLALLTKASITITKLWRYDHSIDEPIWVGAPVNYDLSTTFGIQTVQRPYLLVPKPDDNSAWTGGPLPAKPLLPILIVGGQAKPVHWFQYDEAPAWQEVSAYNLVLRVTPFTPRFWTVVVEDTSATVSYVRNQSLLLVRPFGAQPPRPLVDDVVSVQYYQRNQPLLLVSPFVEQFPKFSYEDDVVVPQRYQHNQALLVTSVPFIGQFPRAVVDDAIWHAQLSTFGLLALGKQAPIKFWRSDLSEALFWTGAPEASSLLVLSTLPKTTTPFKQARWFFALDDTDYWRWPPNTITGRLPQKLLIIDPRFVAVGNQIFPPNAGLARTLTSEGKPRDQIVTSPEPRVVIVTPPTPIPQ